MRYNAVSWLGLGVSCGGIDCVGLDIGRKEGTDTVAKSEMD